MKLTTGKSRQGSTLVITLITCLLIGTILSSYLGLISNRNQMAMRATAWNTAIPVLEAGIEEALTHLHDDGANLGRHWHRNAVNGQVVDWKLGALPDGSRYLVAITNAASASPVIVSTGYVPSPLKKHEYITRIVRVTTTNPPSPFFVAIAASGVVRLSGNAVVDGYNSALGPYGTANNRNASGGIATDCQQSPAIDVGSAHVYGTATTGPGGTVVVNGGSVGDLSQASGIQEGWVNDNMNVQFQPNTPPAGTLPLVQSAGTNILTTGSYQMNSFSSIDKTRPVIIRGDVTLWVTGNFTVLGTGYVYIEPDASLKLYVGGIASISGGGVVNGSGLPANFSYFGLPSNTVLNYSGSADLVGTVNAPQALFTLSGNASVYGAVICDTFNSNGSSGVHYDQALRGGGMFLVTSWRELYPTEN